MNPALINWCFGLSLLFTLIFIIFGSVIFLRYKPQIVATQLAIIVLSVLNLVAKNAGFGFLVLGGPLANPSSEFNLSVIQSFSILTSSCFIISFQILTIHLSIQRRLKQRKDALENVQQPIYELQTPDNSMKNILLQSKPLSSGEQSEAEREALKMLHELSRVKKLFKWYFLCYLSVILIVTICTFCEIFSSKDPNQGSTVIDWIQIVVGLIRLIALDIPMLAVFIYELKQVRNLLKAEREQREQRENQEVQPNQRRCSVYVLYFLPIFMVVIFADRIIFNNIVLRVISLLGHYNQTPQWLIDFVYAHIVLYTVSDFISSCIQLFLTYSFYSTKRVDGQEKQIMEEEKPKIIQQTKEIIFTTNVQKDSILEDSFACTQENFRTDIVPQMVETHNDSNDDIF